MRWFWIALGGWGLVVLSCVPVMARTTHESRAIHGGNCVAYARDVTGVQLDGNAASWWPHAEGHYDRGHQPSVGAILVFKPFGGMHVGHVAVVSRVVGPREVLVDQANWVRGRVTHAMSVVDASPSNDWTSVKVQFARTHGRENPTYGFIYPRALPANFSELVAAAESPRDQHAAAHVAERAKEHAKHPKEHVVADASHPVDHHPSTAVDAAAHHKHKAPATQVAAVY